MNEKDALIINSFSIYITIVKIKWLLFEYISDFDCHECKEAVYFDFEEMTQVGYWLKDGMMKHYLEILNCQSLKEHGYEFAIKEFKPMTTMELYDGIEENVLAVIELLKDLHLKISEAPMSFYGNFFHYQRSLFNYRLVRNDHEQWKMDVDGMTFDSLKNRQTFLVADFLKKKILRFTREPTQREIDQVTIEKIIPHLPYGYEFPDGFEKCCARFRRFISWDDNILNIDHNKLGKYLFMFYYLLSNEELQCLFQFDMSLQLVNNEIASLPCSTNGVDLPDVLATPEAIILLKKAMNANLIDKHYQPIVSRTMAALLANEIAERLKIQNKWKVFEDFWKRSSMYQDYYKALDQKQSFEFIDRIKSIFA